MNCLYYLFSWFGYSEIIISTGKMDEMKAAKSIITVFQNTETTFGDSK